MTSVLELQGVTKSYPAPARVTALQDVSLEVRQGETVAITGPSGSGKSTLLGLIGTLERPTAGSLHIADADVASLTDRELSALRAWRIGFVFQQFYLLDHLTVLENVMTGLLYRGGSAMNRREAASVAVDRVGLSDRATHRPWQLSGGERQRVAIARAVAGRPSILLADEPTGNLDSATGRSIMGLIAGLSDADTTVLVITHDATVASAMRREIRLSDGRVVADSGAS